MLVTIKYFGMLLEQTSTSVESIEITNNTIDLFTLESKIIAKYPALKKLTYNIAVNQKIVDKSHTINNGDELAFLPPFAGG